MENINIQEIRDFRMRIKQLRKTLRLASNLTLVGHDGVMWDEAQRVMSSAARQLGEAQLDLCCAKAKRDKGDDDGE